MMDRPRIKWALLCTEYCIFLPFLTETSDARAAARGGGREESTTRQRDEPRDQGPHRGLANRERPLDSRSRHIEGDHQGKQREKLKGLFFIRQWGSNTQYTIIGSVGVHGSVPTGVFFQRGSG